MIGKILTSLVSLGLLSSLVSAFDASSNSNVAVYWGQNSGLSQERLSTYCTSDSVDIVLLAFLSGFPDTTINFSNQCWTNDCPQIAEDIKTCQANGKVVLLSLGGASGSYGFSSEQEGADYATTLWNTFGPGTADERPFGDAVVDGFDLDIENNNQVGYVALANGLKTLYSQDASKSYYLSASPQCPYPDASVGDVLSQVPVDFAFIQFYNNYCNLNGNEFNYDTWNTFAESAPNSNIKLFVGLPGSESSGAGFADSALVKSQLSEIQCTANFGGVSLWDASSAFGNNNYQDQIKQVLTEKSCAVSSSSSSSATSSSATSSAPASSVATSSAVTSSAVTSSVVTSSAPVSSAVTSAPYQNTTAPAGTSTKTNIATTVITITSCSDHVCTPVPVTTGLTTVYKVDTSYVTYCPLTDEPVPTTKAPVPTTAPYPTTHATTKSPVTKVVTITECADNKCSKVESTSTVHTLVTSLVYFKNETVPTASYSKNNTVPVNTYSIIEGEASTKSIGLFAVLAAGLLALI